MRSSRSKHATRAVWALTALAASACAGRPARVPAASRPLAAPKTPKPAQARPAEPDPECTGATAPDPPKIRAPFAATELASARRDALWAFYRALRSSARGEHQTRIVFFGDSHSATDRFPGRVRAHLQARFGYAGAGLVAPTRPLPWYRHRLVAVLGSTGFRTVSPTQRTRLRGGRVGLSGFAFRSRGRGTMRVRTRSLDGVAAHASRFELFFLRAPGGGRLRVDLDGELRGVVDTDGERESLGVYRLEAEDGRHRLGLSALGDGAVSVLGLSIERNVPGVIVDTLGTVGARAQEQLRWDESLYAAQLRARRPDLVVLEYGTNEAADSRQPIAEYRQALGRVLARIREHAPGAACLLLGPTDHPERIGRRYRPRERSAEVANAQREAAAEAGCATFDLTAATGGPLSMRRLTRTRPRYGAPDHVHFTREGYDALGDALAAALLRGYATWLEHGCPARPANPST